MSGRMTKQEYTQSGSTAPYFTKAEDREHVYLDMKQRAPKGKVFACWISAKDKSEFYWGSWGHTADVAARRAHGSFMYVHDDAEQYSIHAPTLIPVEELHAFD